MFCLGFIFLMIYVETDKPVSTDMIKDTAVGMFIWRFTVVQGITLKNGNRGLEKYSSRSGLNSTCQTYIHSMFQRPSLGPGWCFGATSRSIKLPRDFTVVFVREPPSTGPYFIGPAMALSPGWGEATTDTGHNVAYGIRPPPDSPGEMQPQRDSTGHRRAFDPHQAPLAISRC